ncbi:Zn-ribbon domain-containing protein [Candidatus Woesearchaeota archaeon]|mgnify:CR=1 FL=1|nr:Zn-ribbon domain-containing protein [Candidatus Woesearchaeota archaeon]
MPHQCVRCGKLYGDGDKAILEGCTACGGKLFFYIKKQHLEESQKITQKLTKKEKEEIERDVLELVGAKPKEQKPVVLDFESIRVLKPGKYEIDLVHLFKKEPLIYKLAEGKYIIDLPEVFKKED